MLFFWMIRISAYGFHYVVERVDMGEVVSQWYIEILLNWWCFCSCSNSPLSNPNLIVFPFIGMYSSLNSFSLMNTCNLFLQTCSSLLLFVNFCTWPLMLWSGERINKKIINMFLFISVLLLLSTDLWQHYWNLC